MKRAESVPRLDADQLSKRARQSQNAALEGKPKWQSEQIAFTEFTQQFIADNDSKIRSQLSKRYAQEVSMPLLRAALSNNIGARIRALIYDAFGKLFPDSIAKTDLVTRALAVFASVVSIPTDIARQIADFGVVHSTFGAFPSDSLVLLKSNSTASTGEPCVAAYMSLSGWIVVSCGSDGPKELQWVDPIDASRIYWGHLAEKRKTLTMFEAA